MECWFDRHAFLSASHAFLSASQWLEPLEQHGTDHQQRGFVSPGPKPAPRAPVVTAFAGAASLHLRPEEQQGIASEFKGPLGPDAVHLAFSASGPSEDPMQLRLTVEVCLLPASCPGSHPPQPFPLQQHLRVTLQLDGRRYHLLLAQALHLVVPQQLAARLPPSLQHQAQQHGAAAAAPGEAPASSACLALRPLLRLAPPSPLPYLTLVFAHVSLTIYPLGWKAAAAHVSQEHDAAELARLAQLLAECWQQQRLLMPGTQAQPRAQLPAQLPAAAGVTQWPRQLQEWQQGVRAMVAAAEEMVSKRDGTALPPAGNGSTTAAPACLAVAAASLLQQRRAAAAALPAELDALQAAQQAAGASAAAACSCSASTGSSIAESLRQRLEENLATVQQQQAAVGVCQHLAASCIS